MRSLLILGFIGFALSLSLPKDMIPEATRETRQGGVPPPPEFCTMAMGFPSYDPDPPQEDSSWESWPTFYDNWVYAENYGIIQAPISILETLVCDMQNTELWKAASPAINILSPNKARTPYPQYTPSPYQIMQTQCKFSKMDGLYSQYLYDEFTGSLVWMSSFTFRDFGFGNTYVTHEIIFPEWTADYFYDFFDLESSSSTVEDFLRSDVAVELSRLNYWALNNWALLQVCFAQE